MKSKNARLILAANLKRLLAHQHAPQRCLEISGSNATVRRILHTHGRYGPSLSNLQKIADHFGLEPWQLLVSGFDPENPPSIGPRSGGGGAVAPPKRKRFAAIAFVAVAALRAFTTGEWWSAIDAVPVLT